jgi:mannose-6-phosphate isomerase-like protein (cupin superfamily)
MSESNNGGKPGGWFPDFNYLLLALLAGTLFVSQVPFHQWRPGNPESSSAVVHEVNARPWQDPFEAVNKYAVKENYQGPSEPGRIQDEIAHKIAAAIDDDGSKLDSVNVVAVMLPGGVYYEDGENRRKLRYAVLSGFNAALQYMPENSSSIQYFQNKALRIIYEWLVYQPTHHNLPPLLWQDTVPQAGEKLRGPHFHNGFEECIFVMSGEGCMEADSGKYPVKAGDTLLVPAGEKHVTRNTGNEPLMLLCFFPVAEIAKRTQDVAANK